MDEADTQQPENSHLKQGVAAFLASTLAIYGMMRRGKYQIALLFYKNKGGGGVNLYKLQANGQLHRRFALDYHPFWDKESKQSVWRLHYHRGKKLSEIEKHRPYQGGW
jgi:hypothetical protein